MSVADIDLALGLIERRRCAAPDPPLMIRSSSLAILAKRVQEVARAHRAGDQTALRYELRELASEAALLALQKEIR